MRFLAIITLCTLLKYTGASCYSGSDPVLCSSCGGSCDSENGCLCSDSITTCSPAGTECPMSSNDCCDSSIGLYWDSSLQCCSDSKQCNPVCNSDETCDVTGAPTCSCSKTAYPGITTSNLKPTVTCAGGAMMTSVSTCQLKQLGYDYNTFHLINNTNGCNYTYSDVINGVDVWTIQVKAAKGWCGNIIKNDSSFIYVTNTLYINPISGPLITKNPISYNFTCVYNLTMQTSLNFSINPEISSVILSPENGTGLFTVIMAAYKYEDFTSPLQQDDTVNVGSYLYIGIFSPDADGDVYVLKADKCFGSPSDSPSDPNAYTFIENGSPVADSEVLTAVLENNGNLEARFKFSTFKFQDYTNLYIFCDVRLCNKTTGCSSQNGRSGNSGDSQLQIGVTFADSINFSSSGHQEVAAWTVLVSSLLAFFTIKLF